MRRALFTLALCTALAGPARAQTTWLQCATSTPCKIWYGTATTNANGQWSLTIPATANFTAVPVIIPYAVSADLTLANQASAQMTAATISNGVITMSGTVTLPNTIAVGGTPNKAAGAGIPVNVHAVGY